MKLNFNKNVTILKKTPKREIIDKLYVCKKESKEFSSELELFGVRTRSMVRNQQKNSERTNNAIEKHSNSNQNVTILQKTPKNLDCSKKPLQRRKSKLIDRQFYSKDRYLDDLEPSKLQTRSMARGQQKNKERTNNAIEKHSNSNQNVTILQKTPKNLDCVKKPLQRKKSKLIDPQFYPKDRYLDYLEPSKLQTRSMARGQQKNKEQTSKAESRPLAAKGENFDDNKWQTPRPTINAENVMLRSQVLSQVCNEFGLKCHSLIENMCFLETYYISSKATSTNNKLTLIIDQTFNGEIVKFKYSCSESGNILNFHWPFCNLSFIWAFRGICVEAFFPTIREQFGYPQIEEPNDEEFACQCAGKNFSIFDVHNELRLDELANDLMLIYLQKFTPRKCRNHLIFKEINPKTNFQLHFTEAGNFICVTTKMLRVKTFKKLDEEKWPKFTRAYFRYSVLGKAMKTFY